MKKYMYCLMKNFIKKAFSLKNIITVFFIALVLFFIRITLFSYGINPYTYKAYICYGFLAKFIRELISDIFDIYSQSSTKKKNKDP